MLKVAENGSLALISTFNSIVSDLHSLAIDNEYVCVSDSSF
jgi:hypothetical protein